VPYTRQPKAQPSQEQTMTFHEYLSKAIQDDAQRRGEQDRLLLEARRARPRHRRDTGPAAAVKRKARLLFRRATA
jgi:hypothetical protein